MTIVFLTGDMMFLPQLTAVGKSLGHEVQWALSSAALVEKAAAAVAPPLVVIDLSMSGLDMHALVSQLRELSQPPRAVLAYGPHVQEAKLKAAKESGCDGVFSNGQFRSQMNAILAKFAGPAEAAG